MIKFRPMRRTICASVKDELIFHSIEDVIQHVVNRWGTLSACLGASIPFTQSDVIVGDILGDDPVCCLRNVRRIYVKRTLDHDYKQPLHIGWCGE